MDSRTTLPVNKTFSDMLQQCMQNNNKAAMLLDDHGLVRVEGFIHKIELNSERPYLELDSGIKIILQTIIAVNGIFLNNYSEC